MRINTLFKFLIGDRQALLTIANTPHAIWFALAFVITGGLSRNYDKEPLLHAPEHVFGPLIVSGLIGTGLFLLIRFATNSLLTVTGPVVRPFIVFMTLYWMTAPMAWLYGIPTERMTDIVTATELNLWTLALVSLWRVLLIARVASVIFGAPMWMMSVLVLAFSNVLVVAVLVATPFPIINIMGGVGLSQSEQLISGIATSTFILSHLTIPVLVLTSVILVAVMKGTWQVPNLPREERPQLHRSVTALAIGSLAFWLALLPLTQPAQSLRYETENALIRGDIPAGIALMTEHGREAFPPHWEPPPRRLYGETTPDVLDVLEHLLAHPHADAWIVDQYAEKLGQSLRRWRNSYDVVRIASIAQRLPQGPRLLWEARWSLRHLWQSETDEAAVQVLRNIARDYAIAHDLEWDERSY